VISRKNYGSWYLQPEDWEKRKLQGLENQDLDPGILNSQQNTTEKKSTSPKLKQIDWNF
jgi:hypothetical protein